MVEIEKGGGEKSSSIGRSRKKKRKASDHGFRLTERDLSIMGFLLDQKFASLPQLYFRFFDRRKSVDDPLPTGFHVARQRLQVLRKAGLIFTEKVYTEPKSIYLLTNTGFKVFESRRPNDAYSVPVKKIDFRSYEHDTKVNDCRIALERSGRVIKWLSDRRLKMEGFNSEFSFSDMPKSVVPDGVFISSKAKRVVFEIETSTRKKRRYEEKLWAFKSVMGGSEPLIHHVIWVGSTPKIQRDLKSVASRDEGFTVESYYYFLNLLWPGGIKPGGKAL